jgi:hypothetical protein
MLKWIHRVITRAGKKPTPGCCPECYGSCWRPALSRLGPFKVCKSCSCAVRVTTEEFYAQFGTMPNVGIVAR